MTAHLQVPSGSYQGIPIHPLFQSQNSGGAMQFAFSGFGSRSIETSYNKAMFALLFLFQNTLLKFFDGGK